MSDTVTMTKEQFDDLTSRLAKVETANSDVGVTIRHCNTCGDLLPDDVARCVRHPNDLTNTVGKDRFGKVVLVNQT